MAGTTDCPACGGNGCVEENFAIKGPDARVIDCTWCSGRGEVSEVWAAEIESLGGDIPLPADWVF